jgi:hypothetical protein
MLDKRKKMCYGVLLHGVASALHDKMAMYFIFDNLLKYEIKGIILTNIF